MYAGEVKAHRHSSVDSDRAHSRRTGQVGHARAGPRGNHNHCLDRYSGSIRRRFHSPEPLRGARDNADKPRVHSHSDPGRDNPAGDLPADQHAGRYSEHHTKDRVHRRKEKHERGRGLSRAAHYRRSAAPPASRTALSRRSPGSLPRRSTASGWAGGGSQAVSGVLGSITGGSRQEPDPGGLGGGGPGGGRHRPDADGRVRQIDTPARRGRAAQRGQQGGEPGRPSRNRGQHNGLQHLLPAAGGGAGAAAQLEQERREQEAQEQQRVQ